MKKVLFMAFAVVGAANAMADWSEGFETLVGDTGWDLGTTITYGNSGATNMNFSASGVWVARNDSLPVGTTGWFSNPSVFNQGAHGGTESACANFNNTTGTNTINNWLMTPVITMATGATVSFWTRTVNTPAFPDRLKVSYSSNGASIAAGDFSNLIVDINAGLTTAGYPTQWTQFTYTNTGAAWTGRVGFNYLVTNGGPSGANSDFIGIDDVAYTAAVPEPATMAALGLGVAALLRRRRK